MTDESQKPVDVKGSNLEEAIKNGLNQLGLSRNDVIIEIIEEGGGGFLGMGAKEALVRIIPLKAPNPPAKVAAPAVGDEKPASETVKTFPAQRLVEEIKRAEPEEPEETEYDDDDDEEDQAEEFYDYDDSIDYKKEADIARETLSELLEQMGIEATISMRQSVSPGHEGNGAGPWILNIEGRDLGILIGRRGDTLNALQFVTRLIVSRELQQRSSFIVDVEGYKTRREDTLKSLAHRMASRAKSQGKTMTLEPMPPNERRIIHLTLRGDRAVRTESVGTGERRKVTIIPSVSKK